MARDETTVTQWTCDSCRITLVSEPKNKSLPAGWKIIQVPFRMPMGGYTKGAEICDACARDEDAATLRVRKNLNLSE
jgi:hypothetical protein